MSVRDARIYTCTVRDNLSCTRLQNYTINASLMSVSVSVPWNSSFSVIMNDTLHDSAQAEQLRVGVKQSHSCTSHNITTSLSRDSALWLAKGLPREIFRDGI